MYEADYLRQEVGIQYPSIFDMDTQNVIVSLPPTTQPMRRKTWDLLTRYDINTTPVGIRLQYGKALASITQDDSSVTAHFEDGTSTTGSLLIGCDGGKSVVRRMLVGEQQAQNTHLDFDLFNFVCHFNAEVSQKMIDMHPVFFNSHHKNGYMLWLSAQDVPDATRPDTWLWQIMLFWRGAPRREDFEDQEARMRWLKARTEEYVEPWRSVLKAVPDDVKFGVDRIAVWKPVDWSSAPLAGRVTLAGDAAHPMPPYRGQGLNHAILDASNFVEAMKKVRDGEIQQETAIQEQDTIH